MKTKPIIEKYLTYLRLSEEKAEARIRHETRIVPGSLEFNMLLAKAYGRTYVNMAEQARKYRLAASAHAMVEALRPRPLLREDMSFSIMVDIGDHRREMDPGIDTPLIHVPDGPIWIEFEQPISTQTHHIAAMFFTCTDKEVEHLLVQPQTSAMSDVLKAAGRQPGEEYRWTLNFIDEDGTPTSHYQYLEESRVWSIIPNVEPCPTDECITDEEISDLTGRKIHSVIPCNFCDTILAHWRSWFTTALLTTQGEFTATEDVEWPLQTEQTTRKVKRLHSGKYDEILVSHDYYLVSFDASVKKRILTQEASQERERVPSGSWVAATQEIDPESVVYVRHDFGKGKRELDPERNPRWKEKKTVEVRSHARRLPMKVSNLQRRITRVIASAYEQKQTNEGQLCP